MSKSELVIGTDRLEFNDQVQATMQVYDFRNLDLGNANKSYSFKIPMTHANRKILNFPDFISSEINISSQAKINAEGFQLISGKLQVLSIGETFIKAMINGDDWVNEIKGVSIQDLSWEAGDNHTMNRTTIVNTWTAAAGAFYRYPLINRGQIFSQTNAAAADLYPFDFMPMYNIGDILEKIFEEAGFAVDTNHFFNTTYGAKLYLLSKSVAKPESYIEQKAVVAETNDITDNYTTITHGAYSTDDIELIKTPVRFDADTTDEGGDYSGSTYTAPEDGTYRFQTKIRVATDHHINGWYTSHSNEIDIYFRKNGTKINVGYNAVGANLFGEFGVILYGEFELDSGWIHLDAGDTLDLYGRFYSSAYNPNGTSYTVRLFIQDSVECYMKSVIDHRNREHGQDKTITPAEYLPDIEAVDFLKGLKELFNLVFWIDKMNRKVYCFTHDDFIGTTVTDWSDRVDLQQKPNYDVIASKYAESQLLKYLPDTEDRAYTDYVAASGIPFSKTVELSNTSAKPGVDEVPNSIFAPTVDGDMPQIGHTSGKVPRIFGNGDLLSGHRYPEVKPETWEPRVLEWNGTVALTTGSFDLYENLDYSSYTNYTDFPEAATPDLSDIYGSYLTKRYRIIDNSKLLKVRIHIKPGEISKLITGGTANQGFRGLYKLRVYGQDGLFILTKIETNGLAAICEFVQKV